MARGNEEADTKKRILIGVAGALLAVSIVIAYASWPRQTERKIIPHVPKADPEQLVEEGSPADLQRRRQAATEATPELPEVVEPTPEDPEAPKKVPQPVPKAGMPG